LGGAWLQVKGEHPNEIGDLGGPKVNRKSRLSRQSSLGTHDTQSPSGEIGKRAWEGKNRVKGGGRELGLRGGGRKGKNIWELDKNMEENVIQT